MVGLHRRPSMMPRSQNHLAFIGREKGEMHAPASSCDKDDAIHYVALLKECAKRKDLDKGTSLHVDIMNKGLLARNPYVGSTLVCMYAKCGEMAKAQEVLDELPFRNVVSWSALIAGYAEHEEGHKALNCVEQMRSEGLAPDAVTFTAMLKACGCMRSVERGWAIHVEIVNKGLLGKDAILGNALVDMYAKCGELVKAHQVLFELPARDVFSWNALIAGYVHHGQSEDALHCYEQMQDDGISPDTVTFVCILKACGHARLIDKGEEVHKEIDKKGLLEKHIVLGNALVDMYAKCGVLTKARKILDELPVGNVAAWNALISGYALQGLGQEALNCLEQMRSHGLSPDAITFTCILNVCSSLRLLDKGKRIHDEIVCKRLLEQHMALGNSLVDMYAKCGALTKAEEVLDELPIRDVVAWNALITGYVQQGKGEEALVCFERMRSDGLCPDVATFICILKACGNSKALDKGMHIHKEIIRKELLEDHIELGNALVDMYAKCGALEKAQQVLEKLRARDIVSWNTLISGYVREDHYGHAFKCLEWMHSDGICPDAITFVCMLKACGKMEDLSSGSCVHASIVKRGVLQSSPHIGRTLVSMYAKCGALEKAEQVLEELSVRDVVSWSAVIAGYIEQGQGHAAMHCFQRMQNEGITADAVTVASVLKACGNIGAVDIGEQIHGVIASKGLLRQTMGLGSALIQMYAECGKLCKARAVFGDLVFQDVISWNALLEGYIQHGKDTDALKCFEHVQKDGISPNAVTFTCAVKACGRMRAIDKGKQIHQDIINKRLLGKSVELGNSLVGMYARCGDVEKAREVLNGLPVRDVVSWSVLIGGYTCKGHCDQALTAFEIMKHDGVAPNKIIFLRILKACSIMGELDKGKQIHEEIISSGLLGNNLDLGNALVDMYAKCGALAKAHQVLEELPARDVVSWSTLIAGYAEQKRGEDALKCFEQMRADGVVPNPVTFTCILKACGSAAVVDKGERIHDELVSRGLLEDDVFLCTAVVDMYAKCGEMERAQRVFDELPVRSVAMWNALIGGYAQEGLHEKNALNCFEQMKGEGATPDAVTFACVLSACSSARLVDEGRMHFTEMTREYGIMPDIQHHTCMVDLLGCAGMFDEATLVVSEMPSCSDDVFWHALLGACQKWGNVELGRSAFERLVKSSRRRSS